MRTIDITTSQNVTINYELAPLRDRIFACVIDLMLAAFTVVILSYVFFTMINVEQQEYVYYFVIFPVVSFYNLFAEIVMDGQSPGKRSIGIKVVKTEGIEPSLNDYFVRWAFRPVDIWFSLGSIGCMLISSTEKAQRLGDIVANTVMIRTSPEQKIKLSDIISIRTVENYNPVYPDVRNFSEADMLLLKEVMDRYNRYRNIAHTEALNEAITIVKEKLNIPEMPADKIQFIRTLIKDYVALSR